MPVRLVAFIVILLVIVTFIGFNADNRTDIKIWFGEGGVIRDVPIYVGFFIVYLVGVLSVIPFIVGWSRRQRSRSSRAAAAVSEPDVVKSSKKKTVRVLGSNKRRMDNEGNAATDRESGHPVEDTVVSD